MYFQLSVWVLSDSGCGMSLGSFVLSVGHVALSALRLYVVSHVFCVFGSVGGVVSPAVGVGVTCCVLRVLLRVASVFVFAAGRVGIIRQWVWIVSRQFRVVSRSRRIVSPILVHCQSRVLCCRFGWWRCQPRGGCWGGLLCFMYVVACSEYI